MDQGNSETITIKSPRCWWCKKTIEQTTIQEGKHRKRRYDAKFCGEKCRKAWHKEACYLGQKFLRQRTEAELAQID